jgi:aspartyl-tRNA(Asn)/glutamyl-tRNA(Gln) amidotransferase subunit A
MKQEIYNKIKEGELKYSEHISNILNNINKDINAFISLNKNINTEEIENNIKEGKERKLEGLTFGIKDNILVKGINATAGSKMLKDYVGVYDATVVKKIREAGGVIVGKTNMDEFAMGSSNETSYFGVVKNPHDLNKVPGGSSGGSAASVAGLMVDVALGSDTAGSIRQPASFCGVVGFKPTYGAVSRFGLISMCSSLDVIGPIANNVSDCEKVFNVIAGKDDYDATSLDVLEEDKE